MTFGEAADYIKGQDRRSRQQWEMTRILARVLHKVETGKNLPMSLPWDDENEEEEEEKRKRISDFALKQNKSFLPRYRVSKALIFMAFLILKIEADCIF